jgi:hypothetical protein
MAEEAFREALRLDPTLTLQDPRVPTEPTGPFQRARLAAVDEARASNSPWADPAGPRLESRLEELTACRSCSSAARARAWIYLAALALLTADAEAAGEALDRALELDPSIRIDPDVNDPELALLFEKARARAMAKTVH